MAYKVIGIQHRKYTNKTGKEVDGYNIFCTYEDKAVNGLGCLREWVNPETMEESMVNVGDECELLYNRWGRIDRIRVSE